MVNVPPVRITASPVQIMKLVQLVRAGSFYIMPHVLLASLIAFLACPQIIAKYAK